MTSYFVYGSMECRDFLNVVIGPEWSGEQAHVLGYALPDVLGPFALATEAEAHRLSGVILPDLNTEQAARLAFALQAVGGVMTEAHCDVRGMAQPVQIALGTVAEDKADGETAGIERESIFEIMSYYNILEPEAVAKRRVMILARAAARVSAQMPKPTTLRSDHKHDQVDLIDVDASHTGFFVTRSYRLRHPQFDGTQSEELLREAFVATDAAIVLPYDPVRDRVLLVEQFRMGPYGRGDARPWMLEPVAGRVDAGETPEACAHRECEEEAGLTLQKLIKISSHYCSPGCSTEYFHVFLGICDLPDSAAGHGGLEVEHEDLKLHVVDYDRAMALLDTGEADNGPLVLSLLWLSKTRDSLRASA